MTADQPTPRAPEPGEIIDGALSNFINHVRENADVDPQYGVDARHIRDALRRGDLVLVSPAPLATTVASEPTPGAAQRMAQLIEWAERGDLAGVSLDAIRAALYANAPEPTAPDDLPENIAPSVWRLDADDLQEDIAEALFQSDIALGGIAEIDRERTWPLYLANAAAVMDVLRQHQGRVRAETLREVAVECALEHDAGGYVVVQMTAETWHELSAVREAPR